MMEEGHNCGVSPHTIIVFQTRVCNECIVSSFNVWSSWRPDCEHHDRNLHSWGVTGLQNAFSALRCRAIPHNQVSRYFAARFVKKSGDRSNERTKPQMSASKSAGSICRGFVVRVSKGGSEMPLCIRYSTTAEPLQRIHSPAACYTRYIRLKVKQGIRENIDTRSDCRLLRWEMGTVSFDHIRCEHLMHIIVKADMCPWRTQREFSEENQ